MPKPRGRPFQPGNETGRGRPRGSRNKSTAAAQELLGENGADVIRKCLRMAKQGDPTALRLCMERILPARKSPTVRFKLPRIRSVADLPGAMDSIMQAIAKGRLTPGEGQQILALVDNSRRVLETEERLRPKVKPTYCGKLSQISDQELEARILEIDRTIEASYTDADTPANTALPAKVAPSMLTAEVGNHSAGGARSDPTGLRDDWKKALPQRDWRKP
jgi:hypothetical protein